MNLDTPCPRCGESNPDDAPSCRFCGVSWSATIPHMERHGAVRPEDADPWRVDLPPDERYRMVDELGEGGGGKVYRAYDRVLRRYVAYKVLRRQLDDSGADAVQRFISECQATAQLQHPAIVPIYDLGRRDDGTVYYTMKVVEGETLKKHIARVGEGNPSPGMTRYRLLQLFHQITMAIAFMHSRRLIHRDLKPQNIMVGRFGEVCILDFGLAKVLGDEVVTLRTDAGDVTRDDQIKGTFAYMPPEQLISPQAVNEASDQFALGAILYEILTCRPPYMGHTITKQVLSGQFPRPSDLAGDIPSALEDICLKAMSFAQEDRYRSVGELATALQDFLQGEKELERREAMAASYMAEAQAQVRRFRAFASQATRLIEESKTLDATLPHPLSRADRGRLRTARARARSMCEERDRVFPEVLVKLMKTVDASPGNRRARELLAELCFDKMLESEGARDATQVATYRALVEAYHDGKYDHQLRGDGSVVVSSNPPGALVYLARIIDVDGTLVPEGEKFLGETPTPKLPLSMGTYMATLRLDDHAETHYHFCVGRNEAVVADIPMIREEGLAPGFVYVPPGPFIFGGDLLLSNSPAFARSTQGFCIGRNPITMGEYLIFLNELALTRGVEAARLLSPRIRPTSGFYLLEDGGTFRLPDIDAEGHHWSPDLPVVGVSALDAEAYCAWRSTRDKLPFRLPAVDEWEKAARGADGRTWPWGNEWDDDRARCANSPGDAAPEPVGRDTDMSPYGVLGCAGNVYDWTATGVPGKEGVRYVKGGSFAAADLTSQASWAGQFHAASLQSGIGFRMAYSPGQPSTAPASRRLEPEIR